MPPDSTALDYLGMSDLIEARADSLKVSIDKNTEAMNRSTDELQAWREFAPKLVSSVGQEVRDAVDHIALVGRHHGSGSLGIWLLMLLAYKILLPLLKKWLGIP